MCFSIVNGVAVVGDLTWRRKDTEYPELEYNIKCIQPDKAVCNVHGSIKKTTRDNLAEGKIKISFPLTSLESEMRKSGGKNVTTISFR